jgi:hypothetical protein
MTEITSAEAVTWMRCHLEPIHGVGPEGVSSVAGECRGVTQDGGLLEMQANSTARA